MDHNCDKCGKRFGSEKALRGHSRIHNEANGKLSVSKCCCIITREEIATSNLDRYMKSLSACKQCSKFFKSTSIKKNVFCSKSCSASYSNLRRGPKSEEEKIKIRDGVNKYYAPLVERKRMQSKRQVPRTNRRAIERLRPIDPITGKSLCKCICKHCKETFFSIRKKQYCSNCWMLYMPQARNRFKFTFNIFNYPDLFNLTEIQEKGFYAPGGKSGRWNPEGLTRDHRVSVNEAIKNGYDSYYITHPVNCEIMTHNLNNKKKTRSSISYEELVLKVHEYEKMAPPAGSAPTKFRLTGGHVY